MTKKTSDRARHWSLVIGHSLVILVWSFVICTLASCGRPAPRELVLYTSVDQPHAEPIVREFEKLNPDIRVRLVTDTEASKSVGLAERLRAEKANPQCDVWWGNEPFHTINLAEEGLLQAYESPSAGDVATMYRDPQHRWAGNGLRARVIGSSSWAAANVVGDGLNGLTDPRLKGKVAMARPTAGTTGGHVAALFVAWGDDKAESFLRALRDNEVRLLGGNGPVAEAIGAGTIWAGLTDNDDVAAVQREGGKISMILPDQRDGGTLMIPTTVALVAGSKQTEAAKKLVDYLLSAQVERKLIDAQFAGWSVREQGQQVKAMQIDYREVARKLPEAVRRATSILEARE